MTRTSSRQLARAPTPTPAQGPVWRGGAFALSCLLGVLAVPAAPPARAASILDFDIWMRRIDRRVVEVQRELRDGQPQAALAHAREIEDLYGRMEAYFVEKGHPEEAARLSRESRDLAARAALAIEAQDHDAAAQAAIGIAKACGACHDAYRPFK